MRRILGTYTFYLHTFKNSVGFSIRPYKDTLLEIKSRSHLLEFVLTSGAQQDAVFWSSIRAGADGLGFMLNFPIYSTYSATFEDVIQPLPDRGTDSIIDFDLVVHAMMYDQTAGHIVEADIPKSISFSSCEIEDFVIKLHSNKLLNGAVYYYLKSIEEPEFFLVSLYKAYELIKDTDAVSKTAAKKLTRLANDSSVSGSRHASKGAAKIRLMSPDESEYCQNLIRSGIFKYSHNL